MTDRTLPWWIRVVLLISALMQIGFGLTLLFNPAAIDRLWPWPLTALSARLLGASTLVSVPLALLSIYFNRRSAARLPLIMMITYRVLQLAAGIIHFDRFDIMSPTAINYFGGGGLMLLAMAAALIWGNSLGKPADDGHSWLRGQSPLNLSQPVRVTLVALAMIYAVIAVVCIVLGQGAAFLWFERADTLTGLTARLFASPALGLALAMFIISRSTLWRQVEVPAAGMATFGVSGLLSMLLEFSAIQPSTPLGYLVPITPLVLLIIGVYLLLPARSQA